MDADDQGWERARRLFERALEADESERARILAQARRTDPELAREVTELLEARLEAGDFLEQPAWVPAGAGALAAEPLEELPAAIGRYRVLGLLGRGGMGSVYLAERSDAPDLGRVALKLARDGSNTPQLAEQVERERAVLARLDHPGIARVLDGGQTRDGRPYFVMEYVEGEALHEYVRRRQPSLRERLELFAAICEAVDYAHRRLVVHRDIKPSNVLVAVDGEGRATAKLLDFGIAKVIASHTAASAHATRPEERWLTLAYASPELVRGEAVTTAADVFSLGVLLFELVAGRSPYEAGLDDFALRRAICELDAPRPSAVAGASPSSAEPARRLRGDIDLIVATALRKDPDQRYASAATLARDVRNHLAGRALAAHPDSLWRGVSRFARRNRALSLTAATLVVSLLTSAAVALWQAQRIREEARLVQRVNDLLSSILSWPEPESRGRSITLLEAVDGVAPLVDDTFPDDPRIAAQLHARLGQTYHRLGRRGQALAHLERSLALRRQTGDELALSQTLQLLGDLHYDADDLERAAPCADEALAIRSRLLPADALAVAESQDLRGLLLVERGELDEAEQLIRSALAARMAHAPSSDAELCLSWNNLGAVLIAQSKRDEAHAALERGLALSTQALGPEHLRTALLLHNLGRAHLALGRRDQAVETFGRALRIRAERLGEAHGDVLSTLNSLAFAQVSLNRLDDAAQSAERALSIAERLSQHGELDPRVDGGAREACRVLAWVRRSQAQYVEAEALYRWLADEASARGDQAPAQQAAVRRDLALTLCDQARFGQAVELLEQVASAERAGPGGVESVHTLRLLAEARLGCGDVLRAREDAERACRALEQAGETWLLGDTLCLLAESELSCGAWALAHCSVARGLELLEESFGRDPNTLVARARSASAAVSLAEGDARAAVESLSAAAPLLHARRGPEHPWTRTARERAQAALALDPHAPGAEALRQP